MGINDKITYLQETKELIKEAIINKGVEVTEEDSFRSYADKIADIPLEGGDPYYEELYNLRTSNGTNMAGLFSRATGDNLDLTDLDTSKCKDMQYMFSYCKFKDVDCSGWDTSNVSNVQYMFEQCSSNINTTGWNTSKWTSLYYLFNFFTGSIDISNWDTSNVTNVQYMFANANLKNLNGISTLKLPKVNSLYYLFNGANCDTLDLSSWDTSNVTNMSNMLYNSKIRRIDLSNWNTSKVTNMSYAFYFSYNSTTEELIIPDWDMTNTTTYSSFFGSGSSYIAKLKYIDLSRSNDLTISRITSFLPKRTETTYGDIVIPEDSSQEVIDAIIAKYWRPVGPKFELQSFQISSELDEILLNKKTKIVYHTPSPWYVSIGDVEFISSDESIATVNESGEVSAVSLGNVEIYARLKNNPEVVSNTITINVSETDSTPYVIKFKGTSKPTNNNYMMINGSNVKLSSMEYNAGTGVYTYDVGKEITSIKFNGAGNDTYGTNTITELLKFDFNRNSITSMEGMFLYCKELTVLDVSNWDTSNVTSMRNLFKNCESLTTLDVSKWDTSNVTDMRGMFNICRPLAALDVSKWDTRNVTDMGYIFSGCNSITSIDVSNWDIGKVTNTDCMFFGMPITSLDLSNWNTKKAHTMYYMFKNCTNLEYLNLSSWDISNTTGVLDMFLNVPSTCSIYVDNDTWLRNESQCSFTGTFIRV